jgi:serine/threonine protein kinase
MWMDAVRFPSAEDPEQIGPYTVVGWLGAGRMGAVYLGEAADGRRAAVRVIRRDLADGTSFRSLFRREVDAAMRVQSPAAAVVFDADAEAAEPWVAFEFVEGPNLVELVGGVVPSLSAVIGILGGVADALAAIHEVGATHGDLKPTNVVLVPASGVKVFDYAVSAAIDPGSALTESSSIVGTPAWLAPEQIEGRPVTAASDIFAWGCLAVYAATGRHPFGGADGSPMSIMYRIVHHEPDLSGIPIPLAQTVSAALAKRPDLRPGAEDLRRMLLPGFLDNGPIAPVALVPLPAEPGPPARTAENGGLVGSARRTSHPRLRESHRKRWASVAVAASLLAVAGIAVGLAKHSSSRPGMATAASGATPTSARAPTVTTATTATGVTTASSATTPTAVAGAITSVAPAPRPEPGLVVGTGARGVKVLVPLGWTAQISDGASGSTTTWADPNDPNAKIVESSGIDIGGWYQTDGVSYSINPMRYVQQDANVVRYNNTQFGYAETVPGDPYPVYGAWVAHLAPDRTPSFYSQVQVQLPPTRKAVASTILADFLRNTKTT